MEHKAKTMGEIMNEVSKLQDRIHEKHFKMIDDLADVAADKMKQDILDNRTILNTYYNDRRRAEREYVAALNATSRIERFLSK